MSTYDKAKADKLFSEHIKPIVSNPRYPSEFYSLASPYSDAGPITHYAITPEMLREIRYAFYRSMDRSGTLHEALFEHTHNLDNGWTPGVAWIRAIQPDPKPAWRLAADKARDEGLEFSAVLDAIAAELEKA